MNYLTDWFRNNKTAVGLTVALVAFIAIAAQFWGCAAEDFIKVDVPTTISQRLAVPPRVTLREARSVRVEWQSYSNRQTALLDGRISVGEDQAALLNAFTDFGIVQMEGAIGTAFPAGGAIASLLTFMIGLAFKRPGTDKLIAEEKERSYNKGVEVGRNGTP
jgi:hypothetical protein